ncbi:MAG TPA: 50S ribosomal protein L4 [Bacteroidia bacterium]|nr:MAG: 50S ribosomal protein L4P [Bacteroidetes bacterium OLB10]MBV6453151.1 50S ribosomal protein L4 [Bacteroidia bacterium]MBX3106395.1 50S ribosomal protein L4 [Bacteroidota bacterium]MCE7954229.1 50S ribosomal protein L4 [Bacteroidetes bacterium CHB6]OQB64387.1 MAG: 50S ribosomal protein L4 [Bacteroidetes bacterium ADurb.Bin141]
MELEVKQTNGQSSGRKVTLNKEIFGVEPNDHAIWLDVKSIQANQRQGTHKSKQRNEVSGTTKKLKRQKGTGGARAGSMKSPVFVGGGRVFGPQPRDYSFKLNKKVKRLARVSALSYKAQDNNITILENVNFSSPKTKEVVSLLKNLELTDKKVLLVTEQTNKNLFLSSRNLQRSKVVSASDINTYDILNAQNLVLTEGALPVIENILNK